MECIEVKEGSSTTPEESRPPSNDEAESQERDRNTPEAKEEVQHHIQEKITEGCVIGQKEDVEEMNMDEERFSLQQSTSQDAQLATELSADLLKHRERGTQEDLCEISEKYSSHSLKDESTILERSVHLSLGEVENWQVVSNNEARQASIATALESDRQHSAEHFMRHETLVTSLEEIPKSQLYVKLLTEPEGGSHNVIARTTEDQKLNQRDTEPSEQQRTEASGKMGDKEAYEAREELSTAILQKLTEEQQDTDHKKCEAKDENVHCEEERMSSSSPKVMQRRKSCDEVVEGEVPKEIETARPSKGNQTSTEVPKEQITSKLKGNLPQLKEKKICGTAKGLKGEKSQIPQSSKFDSNDKEKLNDSISANEIQENKREKDVNDAKIKILSRENPEMSTNTARHETFFNKSVPFAKWRYIGLFTKDMYCPSCSQLYDNQRHHPMILTCGHNVCENCLKTKRSLIKSCFVCEMPLTDFKIQTSFPNKGLIEMIKKIKDHYSSDEKNKEQSFKYSPGDIIGGKAENETNEYFLNFLNKLEVQTRMRFSLINFCLNTFKQKMVHLQVVKKELLDFIPVLKACKADLAQSKNLQQVTMHLIKVRDQVDKYLDVLGKYKNFALQDILDVHKFINSFLRLEIETTSFPEKEFQSLISSDVKYHFYVDAKDGKRRYAEASPENQRLHIFPFQNEFPDGFSLFYDFSSIERILMTKELLAFLDMEHQNQYDGLNPNRIFMQMDSEKSKSILDIFYNRNGVTLKNSLIENKPDALMIKYLLKDNRAFTDRDFLQLNEAKTVDSLPRGAVAIDLTNTQSFIFISKTFVPNKKNKKYICIGKVMSGMREISKIKGDCIIKICGIVHNIR